MILLVGSTEPCSGKSAVALGLGLHLRERSVPISYFKPLATAFTSSSSGLCDEDSLFFGTTLGIAILPSLVFLDPRSVRRRLSGEDTVDYTAKLPRPDDAQSEGVLLVEAAGTPQEGALFGLTLLQLAERLPARALIVCRYRPDLVIDDLLSLQEKLGNRLMGVVLNDVPDDQMADVQSILVPFLEKRGMAILGVLPADQVLRSVSTGELARDLGADVLCCREHLGGMVESFNIGAMSVNAALKYFRRNTNKVVLTGGDRTDIQLAALETSTTCLILTGGLPPLPTTVARAEQLEIPILSVHHDTLGAVEIIKHSFSQARFREPLKVERMVRLLDRHYDFERFEALMGL